MLKARYYPDGKLKDTVFSGTASSSWQAISYGLVWSIGNGTSIRVRDNWIPHPHSYKHMTSQGRCHIRFVSELLNENGSWNLELLKSYFMQCDVDEILKIKASLRLEEDALAWGPGKFRIFSVKSAYELAFEEVSRDGTATSSSTSDGCRSWWKMIWSAEVPPVIRNFAWRVATDSLPTWKNNHKRGLELSSICHVCGVRTRGQFPSTFVTALWRVKFGTQCLMCGGCRLSRRYATHGKNVYYMSLNLLQHIERSMMRMALWRCRFIPNESTPQISSPDGCFWEVPRQLFGFSYCTESRHQHCPSEWEDGDYP